VVVPQEYRELCVMPARISVANRCAANVQFNTTWNQPLAHRLAVGFNASDSDRILEMSMTHVSAWGRENCRGFQE
jgi:hypothetical protein